MRRNVENGSRLDNPQEAVDNLPALPHGVRFHRVYSYEQDGETFYYASDSGPVLDTHRDSGVEFLSGVNYELDRKPGSVDYGLHTIGYLNVRHTEPGEPYYCVHPELPEAGSIEIPGILEK